MWSVLALSHLSDTRQICDRFHKQLTSLLEQYRNTRDKNRFMSTTSNFRLKDNICQETLEPASPSRGQVWASDTDYGDRVRDLVLPLPELRHKHLTQALRICVSTRALSQGLLGPTLFFRDLFLVFEAGVRIYILRSKGTFIYPLITRHIYPYNTSLY